MTTSIECVSSGVLVDPRPAGNVRSAICPACGQVVSIGGWPERYLTHREPPESAGVSGESRAVSPDVRPNGVHTTGASTTPAPPAEPPPYVARFTGLGAS